MRSILIKDTTKEEREEINMEYNERYLHGRITRG